MKLSTLAAFLLLFASNCIASGWDGGDDTDRISCLVEKLGDNSIEVRQSTTNELIRLGPQVILQVGQATRSSDPEIRCRAEHIVREIALREEVRFSDQLIIWYPDIYHDLANANTIQEAYQIFLRIRGSDLDMLMFERMTPDDISALVFLMSKWGFCDLDKDEKIELCNICGGTILNVRGVAIRSVAPYIVLLLSDKDHQVRLNAAEALGNMNAKEHATKLLCLFADEHPRVRESAVHAICRMAETKYLRNIVRLLDDPDKHVRIAALSAIGALNAREYSKDILLLLQDSDHDIRCYALKVLLQLGSGDIYEKATKVKSF